MLGLILTPQTPQIPDPYPSHRTTIQYLSLYMRFKWRKLNSLNYGALTHQSSSNRRSYYRLKRLWKNNSNMQKRMVMQLEPMKSSNLNHVSYSKTNNLKTLLESEKLVTLHTKNSNLIPRTLKKRRYRQI